MQKLLISILILGCSLLSRGQSDFTPPSLSTDTTYSFNCNWDQIPDQPWLGYSFWCNSYLDWKVENKRVVAFPYRKYRRTAHYSALQIKKESGRFKASVSVGFSKSDNKGYLGLLIGAGSNKLHEKANLLVHNNIPNHKAHLFSISKKGEVSLSDFSSDSIFYTRKLENYNIDSISNFNISISYLSSQDSSTVIVQVSDSSQVRLQDTITLHKTKIPQGSVALTYTCTKAFKSFGWFDNLKLSGDVFKSSETTGPLLNSFYTITGDSIFLTTQLQPFQVTSSDKFTLLIDDIKVQQNQYKLKLDSITHQVRFRLKNNLKSNKNFTVKYTGKQSDKPFNLNGNIKFDFKNKELNIMALNCNGFAFMHEGKFNYNSLWYPYEQIEKGFQINNPDLVVFLGDQFYESRPSMPINKEPFCYLDYLYKWNLYCLQFRNLTLNTPTIILTDDHDVYQGNLWGAKGTPAQIPNKDSIPKFYKDNYDTWQQDNGGYFMPTKFVNMAISSQTSHLPFPHSKTKNRLTNYYTSYKYGKFDFAILEDKRYKSAPSGINHKIFNGIPLNDSLSTEALDGKELTLLGDDQLTFLRTFINKRKRNIKIVLTQSAYASLTTINKESHPLKDLPATLSGKHKLNRDMDTNGWPKTGRDKALNTVGDHPVLFLAGDQHMGSVVELFDSLGNGSHFFTIPSVSNTWPRTWLPPDSTYSKTHLGIHYDGFGNKMNVIAVANPTDEIHAPQNINKKSPGFGIITINRKKKTAVLHAYPLYFDEQKTRQEYKGWPIKLKLK